jgi:ribosomal protein S21
VGLGEVLLAGVSRAGDRRAAGRAAVRDEARRAVHGRPLAAAEGGVTVYVTAREGEPFEELYRRFKRGMEVSGILREYRRKQRFTPAHEERRDKIRAAQRKRARARGRGRD